MKGNGTDPYDALVIGGGPAGAGLATLLQDRGHRCLVLEGARFPRYHVGESLIPHTYRFLDRLGLIPILEASAFPEKHSVRFVSTSGAESLPFYFSETIAGPSSRTWQVKRSEFDRICLDNARAHGVEVRTATRVEKVIFDNGRAIGAEIRSGNGATTSVRSRVVVDASGRSTVLATQLGLKADVPGLDKTSIWRYYRGGKRLAGIDAGETTIFLIPENGWFWYIPLPEDIVSVGVVASPQSIYRTGESFEVAFEREVAACQPLNDRLFRAEQFGRTRAIPRLAYQSREIAGDGWIMVGDAAVFLDPIYSSGLFLALASAESGAQAIDDALRAGDVSAERLACVGEPLAKGVDVIKRLIFAFYDPAFSFGSFLSRHPEHRQNLINCLVGDVIEPDMQAFVADLVALSPAARDC